MIICNGVVVVSRRPSWTLKRKEAATVYKLFCSVSDVRYETRPLVPHIIPVLTMFSAKPEALFSITRIGWKTKIKNKFPVNAGHLVSFLLFYTAMGKLPQHQYHYIPVHLLIFYSLFPYSSCLNLNKYIFLLKAQLATDFCCLTRSVTEENLVRDTT